MKRTSYVDNQGNPIDHSFESKKTLLNVFFFIGTILPLIIIGFMIYTIVQNNKCIQLYDNIKTSTLEYLKEEDQIPIVEGESIKVSLNKLYKGKYLSNLRTNNLTCAGTVKVTKYKSELVYTLDINNCGNCSTDKRYKSWSAEMNSYPSNKTIVDVIPYYNYYERQVSMTEWSKLYDSEDISSKKSKYGVKLPEDESQLPKIPEGGSIVEIQAEKVPYYRYQDKTWKWYDIIGDYSEFASEQPMGYAQKDENSKIYSEWSEYSLDYPEEKSYRDIQSITGYKFYYEKDGEKIYANNGKYTPEAEVDRDKYDKRDSERATLYRYRDEKWRWYNGQRRSYTSYYSTARPGYPYRDDDTESLGSYSSWSEKSTITLENSTYRHEETKTMTRYRYIYEILSLPILNKPVDKETFIKQIGMTVPEFSMIEEYKVEVTYKFKYKKS